jgi:prolyl oligopeptidase
MSFPMSLTEPTSDMMHGVKVRDPYRWLEDRTSPATTQWLANQGELFHSYFQNVANLRQLEARALEYLDVDRVDQTGKVRQRFFYRRQAVGQQQGSIYYREVTGQDETLLVSADVLSPYCSIGIHRVSSDGALLAYEQKAGGEHSKSIHIVDVETGTTLADYIERGFARGFAFHGDNLGFYYCHELLDAAKSIEDEHQIRSHRFGTSAEEDIVVFTVPRTAGSKLILRSDGDALGAVHCHQQEGVPVVSFYCARKATAGIWKQVVHNLPGPFGPFFCGNRLFAQTYLSAPDGAIIELDSVTGDSVAVVVPEWEAPIREITAAGDRMYVNYSVGTANEVRIWSLDGNYVGNIALERGTSWRLLPSYSNDSDEVFFECESFTKPPTVMTYNANTGALSKWAHRPAPEFKAAVTTSRVTYSSKDGTAVEMSLVGTGDLRQHRVRPVVMTAYGGFGVVMTPQFSVLVTILLELGFVFAVPEIRGGGEKGKGWSEAARGRNRQVAFDDFIAAADWLCGEGITDPKHLGIFGGCNGGLLVGTVLVQRPELFGAAICIAPLLDMIRYEVFDRANIWRHEYGTTDIPEDFHALHAYSPYHNVRDEVNYPPTLFVTGARDTRCNPAHAFKMVARIQNRSNQTRPMLLDYSLERGHSPTLPLRVRVEAIARRIAFLCHELGVPAFCEDKYEDPIAS